MTIAASSIWKPHGHMVVKNGGSGKPTYLPH